jgi:hypothetical protein
MDEAFPQFPNYDPPNPKGIPIADPKFHKPLYKMMRMMIAKPKQIIKTRPHTRRLKRKLPKFY